MATKALLVAVLILAGSTVISACSKEQNSQSKTNTNQQAAAAASDPNANSISSNSPLCTILNAQRNELASASNQLNAEANPLKREGLQNAYAQKQQQVFNAVRNFVTTNALDNYVGKVTTLDLQQYNGASGLSLFVDLPCNVTVTFRFLDVRNPEAASLNPGEDTPLPPWRGVLEQLAVNDVVTFSARIVPFAGQLIRANDKGHFEFHGIISDLRKGLRPATVESAAIPPLSDQDALRLALSSFGGMQAQVTTGLRRYVALDDRFNRGWDDYVAKVEKLKAVLLDHGWSVSGFDTSHKFYYDAHANIEPPASDKQWMLGPYSDGNQQGYAVAMTSANPSISELHVQGDRASAVIDAGDATCTDFCQLWNELGGMNGELARSLFFGPPPSFDQQQSRFTVEFAWDPQLGWHVRR